MADLVRAVHGTWPGYASQWFADGHSQGAHAVLNTAARDNSGSLLGAVATSIPPQIDALIGVGGPSTPSPGTLTGLYAMAFRGFARAHPELVVQRHLSRTGRRIVRAVADLCSPEVQRLTEGMSIGDLLQTALTESEVRAFGSYLRVPVAGYRVPLLIGHGLRDATLPYPTVLPLVGQIVAGGADTRFRTYAGDHDGILEESVPDRMRLFAGPARTRWSGVGPNTR